MNVITKRSSISAAAGTILFWIIAIAAGYYIKIDSPVKDYKEIRIQLSDPSPVKELPKAKEDIPVPPAKAPAKEEAQVNEKKPAPVEKKTVEQKKENAPAPSSVKKTETPSSTAKAAPAKAEAPKTTPSTAQIVKSVEQLAAEAAAKKKTKSFDESLFADEDSSVESTVQKKTPVLQNTSQTSQSSFEGTAASGSDSAAADSEITSSSSAKKTDSSSSSSTSSALSKLASTESSSSSGSSSVQSTSKTAAATGGVKSGSVTINWSAGNTRQLLYPVNPVIKLSQKAQQLIDSTKKVQIKFKVLADGTVIMSDISIAPSSLLPLDVQNEIKNQISKWLFEEDSSDGQAVFDYSIIKE